jgi:uncharacterized protein YjcR
MHGGAKGSGAPVGNRNAWKHGLRSAAAMEDQRNLRETLRDARSIIGFVT